MGHLAKRMAVTSPPSEIQSGEYEDTSHWNDEHEGSTLECPKDHMRSQQRNAAPEASIEPPKPIGRHMYWSVNPVRVVLHCFLEPWQLSPAFLNEKS